ncbi:MAG: hypothetical protein K8F31_10710, partial [Roseovarius sp.]|nr:hypothetical protein [Roseovarius sp.]
MSMVRARGAGAALAHAGLHLGLVLASLAVLLPILWVLRVALAPASMSYSATILPGVSGENFAALFSGRFGQSYINSLVVASGSVAVAMPA